METFKAFPQCVDCLMGMTNQVVALAAGQDLALQAQAKAVAREILADAEKRDATSPEAANQILRAIKYLSGVSDPFARFKAQEMARAQKIFSQLERWLEDNLRSCISLAVLGNSLDFFMDPKEALSKIPDQIREGISFFHDDISRLESFLSKCPGLILYLSDNAGEIYFDIPLYKYIQKKAKRTVLVVKGGPSLNDLTRAELQASRLEGNFAEVADTGTEGVGIDLDRVSMEFLDLLKEADLILSKGMANFESLYPGAIDSPVFFLFKAKCKPIQAYLNSPAESFWALWWDGKPKEKSY